MMFCNHHSGSWKTWRAYLCRAQVEREAQEVYRGVCCLVEHAPAGDAAARSAFASFDQRTVHQARIAGGPAKRRREEGPSGRKKAWDLHETGGGLRGGEAERQGHAARPCEGTHPASRSSLRGQLRAESSERFFRKPFAAVARVRA